MGIDVRDLFGANTSVGEREFHATNRAVARRIWSRDVVCIGRGRGSDDFAVDGGAASEMTTMIDCRWNRSYK